MSWTGRLQQLTNDQARMVQAFTLCRTTGLIISSVVIARSLPIEEVGVLEMLMFCGYVLTFFWTDGLVKGFLARHGASYSREKASAFLWACLLLSLAILTLFAIGGKWFLPLLVHRNELEGLHLFVIYQALIMPVWILPFTGLIRGQQYLLLASFVLLGPPVACLGGVAALPDIRGILIGLVCYSIVGSGWTFSHILFRFSPGIWRLLKEIWPVSWPLILYAVSTGVARSIDAWLVARHFDENIFALFRYGARDFPLVIAFAAGLSTVMIPKLVTPAGLAELKARTLRLMHICYPAVAILMPASVFLFAMIFGEPYRYSAVIFNAYLLLALTQLVFPQSVFMARGDTRLVWYISLAELAVNITASLILLQYIGLMGIVWGTVIAFAFEKIMLLIMMKRRYRLRPNDIVHPAAWAGYAVLLTTMYIISVWIAKL